MKKILHILQSSKFSGAENVVCSIISNLNDNYKMIYCCPEGSIRKVLESKGIEYFPIKKFNYFEIRKAIKSIKPDIVHSHDNRPTFYATFHKNYKIISHIHGNNIVMNTLNLRTLLFNLRTKFVDKFIWVSDSSFDNYYFKDNVSNKSIVLYNVVNKEEILYLSNEYICDEKFDIIFLGRLAYPKDPLRFIDLIYKVKETIPNIRVAIVGDGVDKCKVQERITQYNLNENIILFGQQKNPFPILKQSKILVMTSIYEGMPMSALEAQSLGKPIVATEVDGLKKIIINKNNGILSNDNTVLVNGILSILNEKNYIHYSNNSIKEFEKYNNFSKYIKIISELYEE